MSYVARDVRSAGHTSGGGAKECVGGSDLIADLIVYEVAEVLEGVDLNSDRRLQRTLTRRQRDVRQADRENLHPARELSR